MGQSPTETTDEFEVGSSDIPVDSSRERQSDADAEAVGRENPAIGREWTDFAGANEYESDLSAPDRAIPSDSVIGREWRDFAGTNEYDADEEDRPGE